MILLDLVVEAYIAYVEEEGEDRVSTEGYPSSVPVEDHSYDERAADYHYVELFRFSSV